MGWSYHLMCRDCGTSYLYDNNGSTKSATRTGSGAETDTYTYDLRNRLTGATVGRGDVRLRL